MLAQFLLLIEGLIQSLPNVMGIFLLTPKVSRARSVRTELLVLISHNTEYAEQWEVPFKLLLFSFFNLKLVAWTQGT